MRILLISSYELGHQPLHLATATATLTAAGHTTRSADLSLRPLEAADLDWAQAVAISVPMHTAARIAAEAVTHIRASVPDMPIVLFGLYAAVAGGPADVAQIAGEYEEALAAWAGSLPRAHSFPPAVIRRAGRNRMVPDRAALPPIHSYAHLEVAGRQVPSGYVEASRGCRHRCRHCPVPTVYNGRITVIDSETVLADIDQQIAAGARHITFGDPDFLNAPRHSLRVVAAFHRRHPDITFDVTVKVEHILAHEDVWGGLAAAGCLFVISAFETTNDRILRLLDKGHTTAEAGRAVHLLRDLGVEIRPSWLPFTPWTSLHDIVGIFAFIGSHDLVANTDPVQLSIRLLIPDGSLLLNRTDPIPGLEDYDPAALSYRWSSPDPRVDELQRLLAREAEALGHADPNEAFARMWQQVAAFTGSAPDDVAIPTGATTGRPRMTEPWFC